MSQLTTLQGDFWQPKSVQYEKIIAEMKGQSCCQGDFLLIIAL